MRDKLHKITDLMLDLNEQGGTRTSYAISPHVNSIEVWVWEGEEFKEENVLYKERTYYAGELRNEEKVNEIIRNLEKLKGEPK